MALPRATLAQRAQELTDQELTAERDRVGPCKESGWAITGFPYPADEPVFYVKYGPESNRTAEARTHQYIFDALEGMPPERRKGIHVPRIYRVLSTCHVTYIIMELVRGRTLQEIYYSDRPDDEVDPLFDKIARGIQLLLSIPAPPDASPGPCGGGIIKHPLFKDMEGHMVYDSVDTLEKHINNVATWFIKTDPKVVLERELHLVHADLHMGNFLITDVGDLYLIDFDGASFLPLSFMTFALHYPSIMSIEVASRIRDAFDLPMKNMEVMLRASGLMAVSVRRLGLPK